MSVLVEARFAIFSENSERRIDDGRLMRADNRAVEIAELMTDIRDPVRSFSPGIARRVLLLETRKRPPTV